QDKGQERYYKADFGAWKTTELPEIQRAYTEGREQATSLCKRRAFQFDNDTSQGQRGRHRERPTDNFGNRKQKLDVAGSIRPAVIHGSGYVIVHKVRSETGKVEDRIRIGKHETDRDHGNSTHEPPIESHGQQWCGAICKQVKNRDGHAHSQTIVLGRCSDSGYESGHDVTAQ